MPIYCCERSLRGYWRWVHTQRCSSHQPLLYKLCAALADLSSAGCIIRSWLSISTISAWTSGSKWSLFEQLLWKKKSCDLMTLRTGLKYSCCGLPLSTGWKFSSGFTGDLSLLLFGLCWLSLLFWRRRFSLFDVRASPAGAGAVVRSLHFTGHRGPCKSQRKYTKHLGSLSFRQKKLSVYNLLISLLTV